MNIQEREQLNQFLSQLVEVKLTGKNNEAENLIREAIARQPDAAYLLVQRCLLQDQALATAQAKIAELQNQLQQTNTASSGNSFLNGDPWAQTPANAQPVPGASNYQMPAAASGAMNPGFSRAAPQTPGAAGFGSSFLGNVATTAAGVVAGSILFQGIQNLMGHHQPVPDQQAHSEHTPEQTPDQTVINNYYGDDHFPASEHNYLASDDSDSFFDDSESDSDWV